jgi:hypothetical protein
MCPDLARPQVDVARQLFVENDASLSSDWKASHPKPLFSVIALEEARTHRSAEVPSTVNATQMFCRGAPGPASPSEPQARSAQDLAARSGRSTKTHCQIRALQRLPPKGAAAWAGGPRGRPGREAPQCYATPSAQEGSPWPTQPVPPEPFSLRSLPCVPRTARPFSSPASHPRRSGPGASGGGQVR